MRIELFVALRYLRARRKRAVVSLVTIISIVGVGAGVAALDIALALNTGFQKEFQNRILSTTSHVNLFQLSEGPLSDYEELKKSIRQIPELKRISPVIYGQALLVSNLREQPAVLKGITIGSEDALDLAPKITEGSLDRFLDTSPVPAVVLGKNLASALGVSVGDDIRAVGFRGELSPLGRMPRIKTFRVAAIFSSGLWQYDSSWAVIPIRAAQIFVGYAENQVTTLEFHIEDMYKAPDIADQIQQIVGKGYGTNTWIELNRPLFSALKLEKLAMFIAIGLIVLVASLNIVSTLTLTVMEKTREIAILTAMGGTPSTIVIVFVLKGLIIGLIGIILGSLIAGGMVWYLDTHQLIQLEPQVYSISYLPFDLKVWDAILVAVLTLIISFLATLYPAWAASRLDPMEALRHE